ncbi:MAG: hypothetical protein IT436_17170 [Phycisphaerales bacterium]|nr:hypothetical protein [Phycisphaerales bacterium]
MNKIRELLEKSPWLGWAVAGVILAAAIVLYVMRSGSSEPYSPDRLTQTVSIRFADTGEVIEMPRGEMERDLRSRAGRLDAGAGIINPKTGQATGFPYSKTDWERTIERLNSEKETVAKKRGKALGEPTVKAPPPSVMQPGEGAPAPK